MSDEQTNLDVNTPFWASSAESKIARLPTSTTDRDDALETEVRKLVYRDLRKANAVDEMRVKHILSVLKEQD